MPTERNVSVVQRHPLRVFRRAIVLILLNPETFRYTVQLKHFAVIYVAIFLLKSCTFTALRCFQLFPVAGEQYGVDAERLSSVHRVVPFQLIAENK